MLNFGPHGDYVSVVSFWSFRFPRFGGFTCFVSVVSFRCFGFWYRFTPVSPRVTSTRVNFQFDPLYHICVFMSNLHFMYFDICIYRFIFKDIHGKIRRQELCRFMQIRQVIERNRMFMYTYQTCAQCFLCVCVCVCVLLIHDALILLLSENKIIICDWRRVSKTIVL